MRIVFMGTPTFAVNSLDKLVKKEYDVALVVTQPDKPKGRGKKIIFSDIKNYALNNNLNIFQPKTLKDISVVEKIRELNPDLFVTAAYGNILTKEILDIPKFGCINVHASILPKYRGAAPIHWAIINGEKKTGITTMMSDIGIDTGDILLCEEIEICETDTVADLHDKLSVLGSEVLIKTIKKLENGNLVRTPQNNDEATYSKIIKKDLGLIDWNKSSKEINDLVRGTNPWPGAYTFYNKERMRIWKTEIVYEACTKSKPGTILGITKDGVYIASRDQIVKIMEVQFDSCRRMCIDQYICGHKICEGDMLG